MVHFLLKITAEMENLTNLQPMNGFDDPAFTYYFKVKCGCGEVSQKETCLSLNETVPLPNSKGTTHLIQKCKFCDREGMITMIPGQGRPLTLQLSQQNKYSPVMVFDSRGFEPVDFMFGPGWKAQSVKGTVYEDIDLTEGEFSEYDEKGKFPVMISSVRASFDLVKMWGTRMLSC